MKTLIPFKFISSNFFYFKNNVINSFYKEIKNIPNEIKKLYTYLHNLNFK